MKLDLWVDSGLPIVGGRLRSSGLNTVLLLIGGVSHLAQLVLFLEFARNDSQVVDKSAAGIADGSTGGDLSVGLDPQEELGLERVRHLEESQSVCMMVVDEGQEACLVGGEKHVLGLQQTGAEHVGKGMIFLLEGENRSRGEA